MGYASETLNGSSTKQQRTIDSVICRVPCKLQEAHCGRVTPHQLDVVFSVHNVLSATHKTPYNQTVGSI